MKKLFKLIKNIFVTIFLIALISIGYIIYDGYSLYKEVTDNLSIQDAISNLESDENYVTLENIPETYLKAVVSIEDKRFYEHGAIDLISTSRAMIVNLTNLELTEGGSTITQQLAKNLYFSQEKKFARKVAELFVAIDIENYLNSKDKVLELYANIIYYGDGYTGIYDASIGYFDTEPSNLTLYEQTLLAGLPNAPSVYALSNDTYLSYERQNQVVDAMASLDYISEDEANEIYETNDYIFEKYN